MRIAGPVFALLLLASCAAPAPRAVPSAPIALPAPVAASPSVGSDWRDWPLSAGDWSYARDAQGSIARFGPRGAAPALTLRCYRVGRRVELSRLAGSVAAATFTVRTSSVARSVAAQPTATNPAYLVTALTPNDPLLDAMGFSRGRFVVEQPGAPPLVVPAWAEILRVTEDCRG